MCVLPRCKVAQSERARVSGRQCDSKMRGDGQVLSRAQDDIKRYPAYAITVSPST